MAAITVPLAARADSIEEIAAKANAKAKAQREEAVVERTREEGEGTNLVGGFLLGSVVLSVPFFAENLKVRPPPRGMTSTHVRLLTRLAPPHPRSASASRSRRARTLARRRRPRLRRSAAERWLALAAARVRSAGSRCVSCSGGWGPWGEA